MWQRKYSPQTSVVGICRTGTLISDQHVLTEAHCIVPGSTYVVMGDHYCFSKHDFGQMTVKIKRSYKHPDFIQYPKYKETTLGDIAVSTLEKPVKFSTTILPACLPYKSSREYVNITATAVGWGKTVDEWLETGNQDRLQEVGLTILPMSECQKFEWVIDDEGKRNISKGINESHAFCAGRYKDTDVFQNYTGIHEGDSGGPLTAKDKKTGLNIIIGVAIVAPLGNFESQARYNRNPYFLYSDVKQFLPWLNYYTLFQSPTLRYAGPGSTDGCPPLSKTKGQMPPCRRA